MNPFSRRHRTRAVMLALLGAATVLALALAGAPARAEAKIRMADAFLVDSTGRWFCPGARVDCDPGGVGKPATSKGFAEELLKPGVLNNTRLYLRAAKARNDCEEGTDCTTVGVPKGQEQSCQPAASDTPFCALLSLKRAKVKLGIVISAKRDKPGAENFEEAKKTDVTPPRTPSDLAWQACQIRQADRAHLYDFIFIDYTFKMKYPDTRQAVHMIESGRIIKHGKSARCRDDNHKVLRGWPHVMTNDTTWDYASNDYDLNTGAWAAAKRLGVIGDDGVATADSVGGGFTANDREFVKRVRAVNSQPVLRLEVTPDTHEFAGLEMPLQCSLLKTWAGAQRDLGYTLLFPLFVHGVVNELQHTVPYNSLLEGTFKPQLSLIAHPNKPAAAGCASRAATSSTAGQLSAPAVPPVASTPLAGNPPPPPVVAVPDVSAHEPTNLTCHSARLNGWVNPHGSPTRFHFEYWKRGEPDAVQPSGDGDAGAGTARAEIARVVDGLVRKTGYTGRLVASNAGGRAVSDIFSFTTPGC